MHARHRVICLLRNCNWPTFYSSFTSSLYSRLLAEVQQQQVAVSPLYSAASSLALHPEFTRPFPLVDACTPVWTRIYNDEDAACLQFCRRSFSLSWFCMLSTSPSLPLVQSCVNIQGDCLVCNYIGKAERETQEGVLYSFSAEIFAKL